MKTWLRILLCAMVASYASTWVAATPQTGKDKKAAEPTLTGRWQLVVTFDNGGGTDGALRLAQQGAKVTGSFVRTSLDATVTGTVKGKSVTLLLVDELEGGLVATFDLTGTIENDGTLKGRAIARTEGPGTKTGAEGTFVATRRTQAEKPEKPENPTKPGRS